MARWLITGAGRGIGFGLTIELLKRGDEVVALLRDPRQAGTLQGLDGARQRLLILEADVTEGPALKAAAQSLSGKNIDVLVNNAGVYGEHGMKVLNGDLDLFADVLMVNTVAPLRVLQAFAPVLRVTGGHAKAVTISSAMGSFTRGQTGEFVYRASKAGINKAIQALAPELLQQDIIAFVMHPGWVRTDMGGAGADISIEQSAKGLIATINGAGKAQAGQFLNYDGTVIAW